MSSLGNAIEFLKDFGFFDVVLPFLLVFTIVFGVLEKTKIFGTEKYKDQDQPRRNLNSVVAFCIAFFVVAAGNIVTTIQTSLPIVALVLIVIIIFLLLFGALMGQDELQHGISLWKHQGFKTFFIIAIFTAVISILLASVGYLDDIVAYSTNLGGTFITSLVFLILVVIAIWFITSNKGEEKTK